MFSGHFCTTTHLKPEYETIFLSYCKTKKICTIYKILFIITNNVMCHYIQDCILLSTLNSKCLMTNFDITTHLKPKFEKIYSFHITTNHSS